MERHDSWLVRTLEAVGAWQFAVLQYFFYLGLICLVAAAPQWLEGKAATLENPKILLGSALFAAAAMTGTALWSRRQSRASGESTTAEGR